MPANDSNINDETDFSVEAESYQSVNNAAGGVGGTTTASETFDRVGTAASEFGDGAARPLGARAQSSLDDSAAEQLNDDSPARWIVPLVLLALLIILGYWFCGKSQTVAINYNGAATSANA